jgi:hypothetical protein
MIRATIQHLNHVRIPTHCLTYSTTVPAKLFFPVRCITMVQMKISLLFLFNKVLVIAVKSSTTIQKIKGTKSFNNIGTWAHVYEQPNCFIQNYSKIKRSTKYAKIESNMHYLHLLLNSIFIHIDFIIFSNNVARAAPHPLPTCSLLHAV